MRRAILMFAVSVLVNTDAVAAEGARKPESITPEDAIDRRGNNEVTIRFKVDDVGIVRGGLQTSDNPNRAVTLTHYPIDARHGPFGVALSGEITEAMKRLGISHPDKHLLRRTVEVTGKIRNPDGNDPKAHHSMGVTSLKNFRVLN